MRKYICLLMSLLLICASVIALADGCPAPADKKTYTTTDGIGIETLFRVYDKKFYEEASEQPGTVVKLEYMCILES